MSRWTFDAPAGVTSRDPCGIGAEAMESLGFRRVTATEVAAAHERIGSDIAARLEEGMNKAVEAWFAPLLAIFDAELSRCPGRIVNVTSGDGACEMFGAYWYCMECGKPQLGEHPWKALTCAPRCVACGPGDGFAPCPATHQGGTLCRLCNGARWVESL